MKGITVEKLIEVLEEKRKHEVTLVLFESNIASILAEHGDDWFVIDGVLENVSKIIP